MISMCWLSDVELVINRLAAKKNTLADIEYFRATVDNIEEMRTPDGKEPLTLTALQEWEEQVTTGRSNKKDAEDHHANTPNHHGSADGPAYHLLPNETETRNSRHPRKILPNPKRSTH